MKKYIYASFLILSCLTLNAQITLNAETHTPKLGDNISYSELQFPWNTLTEAGANMTWDFSGSSSDGSTVHMVDPAESEISNIFSSSDLYDLGSQVFYTITDTSVLFDGGGVMGDYEKFNFHQKPSVLKFPLTFGDSYNELAFGEAVAASGMFDLWLEGTWDVEVDGYGTLILPNTTLNNVLRVKTTYNETLTEMSFGSQNTFLRITYAWYDFYNNHPVAKYQLSYVNGASDPSIRRASVMNEADLITSVQTTVQTDGISLFPNPASGYITVENNMENAKCFFYQQDGTKLKSVDISVGQQDIDISDLPSGIYVLKFINDKKIVTRKVFIAK